ncbi:MAG: hypothetical protein OES47_03670 [Acidobacteriota bacterium]|nr:hypothetical protein [Acidobacteriota bacterium]
MTDAAIEVGAEIIVYLDDPLEDRTRLPPVADEPGEALLVVNTFGRRRPSAQSFDTAHCELIEDHTHDPLSDWARASQADWCLASLRKTLPVPVGGVTWSPKGHAVPDPPTAAAAELQVALSRLAGMVLKRIYLEGSPVQKSEFRTLLAATETGLAKLRPSAAPRWASALVDQIPVAAWREQRRENLAFLAESLARAKRLRLLSAADPSGAMFGAVVVFETPASAAGVEARLIEQRIYPARLWPLDGLALDLPKPSVELASKTLFLHCDGRYAVSDLERVARALLDAAERTA